MGQRRVDLRGADIFVPQQFTDRLDGYALRERDRGGEGVACRVESYGPAYVRPKHQFPQPVVAPAVAGERKERLALPDGGVVPEDRKRELEERDVDRRAGLLAVRREPVLAADAADVLEPQPLQIDIGEPREAAEEKGVADQAVRAVGERHPAQAPDLLQRQVVAPDRLAPDGVAGEGVADRAAARAGQVQDVFQGDQVDAGGVLAAAAAIEQVGVESDQEIPVHLREIDILPSAALAHVARKQFPDTFIFIIGTHAAAYAHRPPELLVVAGEEGQQPLLTDALSEQLLLDHAGRDGRVAVAEQVVALFDAVAQAGEGLVDDLRLFAAPRDAAARTAPALRVHVQARRKLLPLLVDRYPADDRHLTVPKRCTALRIKEDSKCISHVSVVNRCLGGAGSGTFSGSAASMVVPVFY